LGLHTGTFTGTSPRFIPEHALTVVDGTEPFFSYGATLSTDAQSSAMPLSDGLPDIGPTPAGYLRDESTDKYYLEILRRKALILEKFSGRSFKILKRRTFGTRCSLC
jgi:hypothetical protein